MKERIQGIEHETVDGNFGNEKTSRKNTIDTVLVKLRTTFVILLL